MKTAVSVFYVFYILAEFPTSLLVKRLQFHRVIPAIALCWGKDTFRSFAIENINFLSFFLFIRKLISMADYCFPSGLISLFTGFVGSFGSLVVTRILLGVFEGCLFPSITLCLCNWYKREELGVRIALLFSKSLFRYIQSALEAI